MDPETALTHYHPLDFRALASAVLANMAPLAQAKKIELQLAEGGVCQVVGDEDQLGLLLRNLLDLSLIHIYVAPSRVVGCGTPC